MHTQQNWRIATRSRAKPPQTKLTVNPANTESLAPLRLPTTTIRGYPREKAHSLIGITIRRLAPLEKGNSLTRRTRKVTSQDSETPPPRIETHFTVAIYSTTTTLDIAFPRYAWTLHVVNMEATRNTDAPVSPLRTSSLFALPPSLEIYAFGSRLKSLTK